MGSECGETGVIWLKRDGQPGFSNAQARQLLRAGHEDAEAAEAAALTALKAHCATSGAQPSVWQWQYNGRVHRLRVEWQPLSADGGTLVLLTDSDHWALRAQNQADAMQYRNLTRLYVGITHDLRSPLNAMVMNLELLKRMLQNAGPAQERQQRYATVLSEEIRRLHSSLNLLLEQLAPVRDEATPINLNELLATLQQLLAPQLRQQRITLTMTLPARPIRSYGCADRLRQALLSVLITVLRALPDDTALTVALAASVTQAQITIQTTTALVLDPDADLAAAQAVLAANGGAWSLETTAQGGSCLYLILPLAAA